MMGARSMSRHQEIYFRFFWGFFLGYYCSFEGVFFIFAFFFMVLGRGEASS